MYKISGDIFALILLKWNIPKLKTKCMFNYTYFNMDEMYLFFIDFILRLLVLHRPR